MMSCAGICARARDAGDSAARRVPDGEVAIAKLESHNRLGSFCFFLLSFHECFDNTWHVPVLKGFVRGIIVTLSFQTSSF